MNSTDDLSLSLRSHSLTQPSTKPPNTNTKHTPPKYFVFKSAVSGGKSQQLDCGRWTADGGRRTADCGRWWTVVDGGRRTVDGGGRCDSGQCCWVTTGEVR